MVIETKKNTFAFPERFVKLKTWEYLFIGSSKNDFCHIEELDNRFELNKFKDFSNFDIF